MSTGLRVKKCIPNCTSPTSSTVYIFSGSKVVAEYDNGAAVGSPSREYIYSGAALLAKIDSSGTKYYHQDHLSNRLITDSSGSSAAQQGHFPFGEQWYPVLPASAATKWEFTTYERYSESGNDYAQGRFYMSRLACFSSPDPVGGNASDPQSLNRYAYGRNIPVSVTDPTGLNPCNQAKNSEKIPAYALGGGLSDGEEPSPAQPPPPCVDEGGGADCWVIIDGGEAPCVLAGSCEANVICPNGDCSVVNQGPLGFGPAGAQGSASNTVAEKCKNKILTDLNQKLGTNFTANNVTSVLWAGIGKAVNINVDSTVTSLAAAQFNAIVPGARWSVNEGFGASVLGIGPSVHIANPGSLWDRSFAQFSNSNVGGVLSVQFTAILTLEIRICPSDSLHICFATCLAVVTGTHVHRGLYVLDFL